MADTCENTLNNNIKCHREVRYRIGHRVKVGIAEEHVSMAVCGTCDRKIGRNNLMRAGWTLSDAIKWERDPDMTTPRIAKDRDLFYPRQKLRQGRPSDQFHSLSRLSLGYN